MRNRSPAIVLALAVVIGLLTATPSLASFTVKSILFPHGATTFYSPFSGPASITFDFNDFTELGADDPTTIFQLRLRVQGSSTAVHTQNVTITPASQTSPRTETFSWPALNVGATSKYEVAVYRGSTQLRARAFTMKPWLAKVTSISPDPFFPTISDNYRDTTDITWQLAANSNPVDLVISDGNGAEVRHVHYVNRVAGTYHFIWNGRSDASALQPVGEYTVRVTATDFGGIEGTSDPVKVRLERFYTVTATKVQNGDAFDHRDPVDVLRVGGSCGLRRLTTPHDLRVNCRDARVKVSWAWTLPATGQIDAVSFDLVAVPGYTCGATKGSAGHDSFLQVGALGQRRCRVDKARITYSYQKES